MSENNGLSLGFVVGLIKNMVLKYGGTGIASVEAVPPNGIKFTFSDGSSTTIDIDITAEGVAFDDSQTKLGAANVQEAISLLQKALDDYASLIEENTFEGKQNFNGETEFNSNAEHNADINVHEHTVNVTDTASDSVAKYGAKSVIVDQGGNDPKEINLPNKAGTFARVEDINEKVGFKYAKLENVDTETAKEDAIITEDIDASIGMYHRNGTSQAGFIAQKNYSEQSAVDTTTEGKTTQASVTTANGATIINAQDSDDNKSSMTVTPEAITFNKTPAVNGDNVLLSSALGGIKNYVGETRDNAFDLDDIPMGSVFTLSGYIIKDKRESSVPASKIFYLREPFLACSYVEENKNCIKLFGVWVESNMYSADVLLQPSLMTEFKQGENYWTIDNHMSSTGSSQSNTGVSIQQINGGFLNTKSLMYNASTNIYAPLTSGTSGQLLQSNGANNAPTWTDNPSLAKAAESVVSAVYVRDAEGVDTTKTYSFSAEGDTIAYRNTSGRLQTATPVSEDDAVNKAYADKFEQKYLSLTGESGTLDDEQYALVTGYDNLIIQRVGLQFIRCGYPSNGQGNYTFVSPYWAKPNGTEEWADYYITIKQDKTWEATIKNHISISEQTYPSVVELTPNTAVNGTLSDDNFDYLTNHDDVKIKLNGEYYILMDDEHTEGIVSYIHEGWNGNSNQVKSINITLATKAWTLVIGKNKYYRHYIQLTVGDKTIYYDFSSTQETAYTADTLPAMPDDIITAFQVVAGGYYSSVSGLVYRNSENALKVILHGMFTTDGATMTYLQLAGSDATFVKDTVKTM